MTHANDGQLILPVSCQDHIQGTEMAAITLVKYGDYQCSECSRAYQIVRQLQDELGDRLRVVFRHFPQSNLHLNAQHAAEAAEAAAVQGKFWEMHHCLFEHQHALSNGYLFEYAMAIGLDSDQFLIDMTSDAHVERVQRDYESGVQSGVISTPTFFINGFCYRGSWDRTALLAELLARC